MVNNKENGNLTKKKKHDTEKETMEKKANGNKVGEMLYLSMPPPLGASPKTKKKAAFASGKSEDLESEDEGFHWDNLQKDVSNLDVSDSKNQGARECDSSVSQRRRLSSIRS